MNLEVHQIIALILASIGLAELFIIWPFLKKKMTKNLEERYGIASNHEKREAERTLTLFKYGLCGGALMLLVMAYLFWTGYLI